MDNDAGDWMPWFHMDAYLATSPQNDVQGDMFAYNRDSAGESEDFISSSSRLVPENPPMASFEGETNTLDTLSHQPQGLNAFATPPAYGEATFQGGDDKSIESESWVPFRDGSFLQDIHGSHGAMTQDPGAQPLTSSSSPAIDIDPYLSYAIPPGCSCMACLLIGVHSDWKEGLCCRFKDCNFTTDMHGEYIFHERDHYREPGNPLFRCVQQHCKFATKRWPDLIRHYTVRHCTKPKQFPCPVPWCKYSGGNGFARKDKLQSHQRNVHQGHVLSAMSSSILRPIQPAMPGSRAPAN